MKRPQGARGMAMRSGDRDGEGEKRKREICGCAYGIRCWGELNGQEKTNEQATRGVFHE